MPSPNPYVGPRPFEEEDGQRFFGRDLETRHLTSLVIAHRIVLFYAPSGAGKTSLLKAGIIPSLRQRKKVKILPISRVSGDPPSGVDAGQVSNIFIFNTLLGLAGPHAKPAELMGRTLQEGLAPYLHGGQEDLRPRTFLLILDQFEELFTHHRGQHSQRVDFFRQLQECLEAYPQLSLLIAMREDLIARLDYYVVQMYDRLRTRFRMERLEPAAALEALRRPAELAGRPFESGVAETLVDNLRRIRTAWDGDNPEQASTILGTHVEPVHLQIVCHQLWENLPTDRRSIQASDVQAFADVDVALSDFYEQALDRVLAQIDISPRRLRAWFDQHLITPTRTRGLVFRGPDTTEGLPNDAVAVLDDAYLLRANVRSGEIWYELAYDRLVAPILDANRRWLAGYFNPLARATQTWLDGRQDPQYLLQGTQLREAEAYTRVHPNDVLPEEAEFLAASQRQEAAQLEEERQRNLRRRNVLIATVAVMIALTALTLWALQNAAEARRQARLATSRELAAAAVANLDSDPERSVLLAGQALEVTYTQEGENALRLALQASRIERRFASGGAGFTGVAYSPDGANLAASAQDGVLSIWSLDDPNAGAMLTAGVDSQVIWVVAYSPDGTRLASAHADGQVRIWDTTSGQLLLTLSGHALQVLDLAFSSDGSLLASGSLDTTARIWDLAGEGQASQELTGHTQGVAKVAFSPDGTRLATAGRDGTVRLWDVATGSAQEVLEGHTGLVLAVGFNPRGTRLVTGGADKNVVIWNVSALPAQRVTTLPNHTDSVLDVAFSGNGRCLATASFDRTINLFDTQTWQVLMTLAGHENGVMGVDFRPLGGDTSPLPLATPCGSQLASASLDGTVRLWNIGPSVEALTLSGHAQPAESAAYSPECLGQTKADDGEQCSRPIATGSDDGVIKVWDGTTGQLLLDFTGHSDRVNQVAFSPDGRSLASASWDGTAKLWDASNGQAMGVLADHGRPVQDVAFNGEGTWLATASDDGSARLIELPSRRLLNTFTHGRKVYAVAFSPACTGSSATGATECVPPLATGGEDRQAKVWDLESGSLLITLPHDEQVYDVAFSPNGSILATASWDGLVTLWSLPTGEMLHRLTGHVDRAYGVAFSPDGTILATASADRSVRLWEVATGLPLSILPGPEFNRLDFSPDGSRLVAAGEDGTGRIYLLKLEDLSSLVEARVTRQLSDAECRQYLHQESCAPALGPTQ